MKKILLVCSAGMSTSMLVKKMQMYATIKKLDFEIVAKGIAEAKQELSSYDAIMIGPQISYALDEVKKMSSGKPVELIPTQVYALAKGEDAVKQALKMMGE
ncbi:PTS sugar transporter subunit IIB [Spiroplasma turonicum]|uniref:PTS system cellobiose-specific IIB component n=1 Tax=Spiroplasma turonicum TaxID=216946 RepID=A0A0K1P5L8_9MOLU|nr:PTS sugar transporter subunit IIB [Spiroplasma turonicum]AKU79540.1 PTS system cellobiose-specific IIB component [Spiroplasma turonicum]ALX70563.1 PTS system, cellobiose-specific IIB component [Spiroplasma turonicum]